MICRTSEIILSFYQKDKITEQVHNDVEHWTNARNKIKTDVSFIDMTRKD